jgi:3-hydroxymyristoyl/3-hydroxydecanoyl-(acyl carrier protein) dehydratase
VSGAEAFARREITADGARATLRRAHAQELCDGHFPDEPLLPGAYVLGLMADLAAAMRAERGMSEHLSEVVQSSFLLPLRPNGDVELHARIEKESDGTTVSVEARVGDRIAARATLRFA